MLHKTQADNLADVTLEPEGYVLAFQDGSILHIYCDEDGIERADHYANRAAFEAGDAHDA